MLAGLAPAEAEASLNDVPIKSKTSSKTAKNFLDALAAVLAGNAIYYLLMPRLPAVVRHRLFREDLGLFLDFAICTVIFVAVKYMRRDEA